MALTYHPEETTIMTRPHWLARLSVEDGLYVLIAAAAAVMRLVELGRIPLSPAEAQEALASWSMWQPDLSVTAGVAFNSPAYVTFTSLLSQIIGSSDAAMRLVPALFGIALVFLPRLLRDRLGRTGALVASLLLALSPTQAIIGRTAGGLTIAAFAILLLLIAWLRAQDAWLLGEDGRPWLYVMAGALGLGLATAPLFYGALITLLLAWLAQSTIGPPIYPAPLLPVPVESAGPKKKKQEPNETPETLEERIVLTPEEEEVAPAPQPSSLLWWPDRASQRTAAIIAAIAFIITATMFLWNPAGFGAAARLAADWLRDFAGQGDPVVWLSPLLAFGRYELALFLFGIVAIIWATWNAEPLPTFLVYWFILGLVLILLQRGQIENIVLLTLPGYLLVGIFIDRHLPAAPGWLGWLMAGVVLLLGLAVYLHVLHYVRASAGTPDDRSNLYFALVVAAFAIATVNFVRTADKAAANHGAIAGLLALLLIYSWGTGWWLSHEAANDPRERWVVDAADNEAPLLAETLHQVSRQTGYGDDGLPVLAAVDSPVLRWYLRDFTRLQIGEAVPPNTAIEVIITPAGGAELALPVDYTGTDFGLLRPETPHLLAGLDSLRWLFYHQSPVTMNEERVILWLRTDLVIP
jgi:hypothetical protein